MTTFWIAAGAFWPSALAGVGLANAGWILAFFCSTLFVLYVMFGYPVFLGWLSRRGSRPIRKDNSLYSVSVVIAVHNGAPFLSDKLNSVLGLEYPKELLEVLVVSDGSTDETDDIVRDFAPAGVKLLRVPRGGKPAALNAGIAAVSGEILLLTDVRQKLAPESLRQLIACFADETVGVVSGELLIRKATTEEEENVGLYWRYETWIRNQLGSIDSIFGATGPFYAMRRSLAKPVPPDMLLDDVYLPLAAFFQGYRLTVERSARAIDYPTTLETEFKRKVRTLAGNLQIIQAYPALLGPRNRMWFHFVSYKLGRLLLPYALILTAISSFFLPAPFAWLAVVAQCAFYLLSALDVYVPSGTPWKRISSPARTFVMMMIAAVCAISVFFVPPRSLWKETKISAPATRLSRAED
jgi:cellulose synthase/poly-beta-1,6-N-acetylglucosamine synthase-like glycosyltransferase